MTDIVWLDATELARRIRARELSPVEVLRAHRERAEAVNGAINAIVTPIEEAEELARAAEAAVLRGDELGPLHGVPFTIKDSFDTAGVRTTRGSLLFAEHVPAEDAVAVARLRAAGAIPLGKTNLPEFALWWETGNLVFGTTRNPWNLERTAGGSSGGEAAAVAAGLSPLGIGSDLGGSIRLPAHYCGVVGLKPTHGRVPLTGHWPEVILRFMHVGPLARTVRDAALALAVVAGPDGRDWHAQPAPPPVIPEGAPLPPLRVGVLGGSAFGPLDAEVAAAVARAASALGELGCSVEIDRVPALEDNDWNVLTLGLYGAEGRAYLDGVVGARSAELHPFLRRRLSLPLPSLEDYLVVEAKVEALRRELALFFLRHDVLLCHAVPITAHEHEATEVLIAGAAHPARTTMRATIPFDLSGSPALVVPFGWSREELPIGVQVVGPRFDETAVLRVGLALEALGGGFRRRPPL